MRDPEGRRVVREWSWWVPPVGDPPRLARNQDQGKRTCDGTRRQETGIEILTSSLSFFILHLLASRTSPPSLYTATSIQSHFPAPRLIKRFPRPYPSRAGP
jgi:hypothetical protein